MTGVSDLKLLLVRKKFGRCSDVMAEYKKADLVYRAKVATTIKDKSERHT